MNKKIMFLYEFSDLGYEVIEHVGVEYIAAFMESKGWCVDIINTMYEKNIIDKVTEFEPDIIGISVTTPNIIDLMKLVKNLSTIFSNIHFFLGGIGASLEPYELLKNYEFIEAIVIGEGEITVYELSESIVGGASNLGCIDGICYRDNKCIRISNKRNLISNINELPQPKHIAYNKYSNANSKKYIALSTTRGCRGRCSFCYQSFTNHEGIVIRNRNPELIIQEIEDCIIKFGVRRFSFVDQTFEDANTFDKRRIEEFADLIIKKGIDIIYTAHIRTENWFDSDLQLINKLRLSGLVAIYPGIESANSNALKLYKKYSSIENHIKTIILFRSAGINLDIGFIMINPYTTIPELKENIRFLKEYNLGYLVHVFFNRLILFPGLDIIKRLREDGLLLSEPSYKNFNDCQYSYIIKDMHVSYIVKNFFGSNVMNTLKTHDLYILGISWGLFISICELKYSNKLGSELKECIADFNNFCHDTENTFINLFSQFIDCGEKFTSEIILPNLAEYADRQNSIFKKSKFRIIRKLLKSDKESVRGIFL